MNRIIARAYTLLESKKWAELLTEIRRLEATGALDAAPSVIKATAVGMKADALEAMGDVPGALEAIVESLRMHHSGALHYGEFVLRHDLSEHYQRAEDLLSKELGPITKAEIAKMDPAFREAVGTIFDVRQELRTRRQSQKHVRR